MDLTLYEKMLGISETPDSTSNSYVETTVRSVNSIFAKTPSYRKILLNGDESECIFNNTKDSLAVEMLFRPRTSIYKGDYVQSGEDTYIAIESIQNEIYPKSEWTLCNSTLKWKDNTGFVYEYMCTITGDSINIEDMTSSKDLVSSSESEVKVVVQYNEDTKKIKPTDRFIFNGNAYEVDSIDAISHVYKEKGYIELSVVGVSITESDDIVDNVADDSSNSGWGAW